MFDTIVLLTSQVEREPLAAVLRGHNPQLTIYPAASLEHLAAFDAAMLARARLIAFATPVIVPGRILASLGYGAYNFHPGPPQYPGWAPAHFALYEQATEFGVTAHAMAEHVDSGPIVDVTLFPIPADIGAMALEGIAYAHLARLFWELAEQLASEAEPLPERPLRWSGKKNSRRAYQEVCDIPLDITKEELDRRMKVFGDNHFGMSPTIRLHGVEFRAVAQGSAGVDLQSGRVL
jgi:methionyl-tRNA formyltransferase